MGREGVVSVDVICPGFSSDCLETLEEVSLEVREAFLECGGKQFAYIPCLNDRPAHIAALTEILKPSL
jgi:ferrochelatase